MAIVPSLPTLRTWARRTGIAAAAAVAWWIVLVWQTGGAYGPAMVAAVPTLVVVGLARMLGPGASTLVAGEFESSSTASTLRMLTTGEATRVTGFAAAATGTSWLLGGGAGGAHRRGVVGGAGPGRRLPALDPTRRPPRRPLHPQPDPRDRMPAGLL